MTQSIVAWFTIAFDLDMIVCIPLCFSSQHKQELIYITNKNHGNNYT